MTPIKLSKFLSLVLRHRPQVLGLELDAGGWVPVDELLTALRNNGRSVSRELLDQMVREDDKQRYTLRDERIRANQGHSIDVQLGLDPVSPPAQLFHGTATRFVESIRKEGLVRRSRRHVHLSSDLETAQRVGQRHGELFVFLVDAAGMAAQGHEFFLSENGVWLTEAVPPEFLSEQASG